MVRALDSHAVCSGSSPACEPLVFLLLEALLQFIVR